jgi:outer membrane protein OmpA-like peptidoglycan-associated protein
VAGTAQAQRVPARPARQRAPKPAPAPRWAAAQAARLPHEGRAAPGAAPAPRLPHDFGRVGVHGPLGQVEAVLRAPGRPLDPALRHRLEAGFSATLRGTAIAHPSAFPGRPLGLGSVDDAFERQADALAEAALRRSPPARTGPAVDLSAVRLHTDREAAHSARAVRARAYAVGYDVVFAAGEWDADAAVAQQLLAHELAHVLQQAGHDVSVQRVLGFLRPLWRLFGSEDYDPGELDAYLRFIDGGKIEDNYDSDNKARAITNQWKVGGSRFELTPQRKAVIIKEMQEGYTSGADERAILTLLDASYNTELTYLFGPGGLTAKSLNSDFSGDNYKELVAFYGRRFKGGMDALLNGTVDPQGDPVPVGGPPTATPPTATPPPAAVPAAGPGDFQIHRVAESTDQAIYFGQGSTAFDDKAKAGIDAVRSANTLKPLTNVRLVGYSSADEPASEGQARADAVKAALGAMPNKVTVTCAGGAPTPLESADYSRSRRVDIVTGAAKSAPGNCATHVCGLVSQPPTGACSVMDKDTLDQFKKAHPIAKEAVEAAVKLLTPAPSGNVAALIDGFFRDHTPATMTTLRSNFARLQTHVTNLPSMTTCGGQCDTGGCDNEGTVAYNKGVDPSGVDPSRMTICVPGFKKEEINNEARVLIHESAHGTSPLGGVTPPGGDPLGAGDISYGYERVFPMLFSRGRHGPGRERRPTRPCRRATCCPSPRPRWTRPPTPRPPPSRPCGWHWRCCRSASSGPRC